MDPLTAINSRPHGRLAGRYRLVEPIGSGGMGHVYRAHDDVLDREVAVKLLDAAQFEGPEPGSACAAEARAAARLAHPGIARVFDGGVQDGRCFVVMELVPGRSLADVLSERRTLPPLRAAELVAQVADALEEAHRQGIIHCDVKPQNIMVTPDGSPKIVDFGVARALSGSGSARSAEIFGSALYLAPEQARGERLDARADVYALGCVLYELLTGRPPFTGHNTAEIIAQRLVREPPPPSSLDPNIPAELDRAVMDALATDPAQRHRTAGDFAEVLRRAARHISAVALARTIPNRSLPLADGVTRALRGRAVYPRWLLRARTGIALAAAILALGGLLAAANTARDMARDREARSESVLASPQPTMEVAPEVAPPTAADPPVAPIVAPVSLPGPATDAGRGASQMGSEAERKAEAESRKKLEEAAKKAQEEREKANEEARKKAEQERKKADEPERRGGRR
jgi:hypothetical protein